MIVGFYNVDPSLFQDIPNNANFTIVFIGHYNVPKYSSTKLMISGNTNEHLKLLTDESSDYNKIEVKPEVYK